MFCFNGCVVFLFFLFFLFLLFFFFNDTATTEIYTLSLHDALPIRPCSVRLSRSTSWPRPMPPRSEEHTSELQSPDHLVCRLLLEKKKKKKQSTLSTKKNKNQNITNKSIKQN